MNAWSNFANGEKQEGDKSIFIPVTTSYILAQPRDTGIWDRATLGECMMTRDGPVKRPRDWSNK
jgi:hypothetical protein